MEPEKRGKDEGATGWGSKGWKEREGFRRWPVTDFSQTWVGRPHLTELGQTEFGQNRIWPTFTDRIGPNMFDRIWPDQMWPVFFWVRRRGGMVGARRVEGPEGCHPKREFGASLGSFCASPTHHKHNTHKHGTHKT